MSHTLHLCFFWVPDVILELKVVIIRLGTAGPPPPLLLPPPPPPLPPAR